MSWTTLLLFSLRASCFMWLFYYHYLTFCCSLPYLVFVLSSGMYAPWEQWLDFICLDRKTWVFPWLLHALLFAWHNICWTYKWPLFLPIDIVQISKSYEFITKSLIQVPPYVHLKRITLPPDLLRLLVEGWACPHLWDGIRVTAHSSLSILYSLTLPPQYLPSPCPCLWFSPSSLPTWHGLSTPCSLECHLCLHWSPLSRCVSSNSSSHSARGSLL